MKPAIPNNARLTLATMKKRKVIKMAMDERMQRLLAECETDKKGGTND